MLNPDAPSPPPAAVAPDGGRASDDDDAALAAAIDRAAAGGAAAAALAADAEDARLLTVAYGETSSEAASIMAVAMELDRAGDAEQAVAVYQQAAERFSKAAAACPEGNPDRALLARRAGEVLGRIVYLESLGGAPATVPPEEHIAPAEPTTAGGGGGGAAAASSSSAAPGGGEPGEGKPTWRKAASAAAVVGGAGLAVLHAPVVAAAMAAGAAYASTRQDDAGKAARSVGDAGLVAAERAQALAEEHRVTERIGESLQKVKAMDAQYGVTDKATAAAATSWQALRDFDKKHRLSSKAGKGLVQVTAGAVSASSTAAGWLRRPSAASSSG